MKNERILAHTMSQKLTKEDIENVSAAGMTSVPTAHGSYSPQSGWDSSIDLTVDF